MKFLKYFSLLASLTFVLSCDDGDVVINDFQFQENDLEFCNTENRGVIYNINDSNEVIFIELNSPFNPFSQTQDSLSIEVSDVRVTYQKLSGNINGSTYFCNAVPDNSVDIIQELRDNDRGEITIRTFLVENDDIDNDGLTNIEEGINETPPLDTDGDDLPNYMDLDDDNDNVPTSVELIEIDDVNNPTGPQLRVPRDTDGDMTPNHLDKDDDGDGIDSRNEVNVVNANPNSVNGVNETPRYLSASDTDQNIPPTLLIVRNIITRSFRTTVVINDLGLTDDENSTTRDVTLGEFTENRRTEQEVLFTRNETIDRDTTTLGPIETE